MRQPFIHLVKNMDPQELTVDGFLDAITDLCFYNHNFVNV